MLRVANTYLLFDTLYASSAFRRPVNTYRPDFFEYMNL